MYAYTYIILCVCVCVCLCVNACVHACGYSFFLLCSPIFVADLEHVESPSEHQGRVRSFPHVRGNWASHVYVPGGRGCGRGCGRETE